MTSAALIGQARRPLRCVIYTRKSSEHGLEQEFNSLDNQREAAEAYVKSQAHEGWRLQPEAYDDGGWSGGSLERPGLQRLLAEVRSGRVDVIVVYKVDRLTRSLSDFAKRCIQTASNFTCARLARRTVPKLRMNRRRIRLQTAKARRTSARRWSCPGRCKQAVSGVRSSG